VIAGQVALQVMLPVGVLGRPFVAAAATSAAAEVAVAVAVVAAGWPANADRDPSAEYS